MKILTIIGARPQFIKAAAVSRILNQHGIDEILVHTGQHYDSNMSEIFFTELELAAPHYNLGVGSKTHGQQTAEMLAKIEVILLQEQPDWVVVYGDTNSTLAGALAAAKLHIPVAHIEAGLRSFNRRMPEEINRIVADQLASYLFAPTEQAVANLMQEGYAKDKVKQVGDVMYDAAAYFGVKATQQSQVLQVNQLQAKQYVLATIHRAENTDDFQRLTAICQCLTELSQYYKVVLPLHPRTRKMLHDFRLWEKLNEQLTIIEPVGFIDMVMLEKNAKLIITDSGGVQKEAYFYRVPCVTLRDETEWVELVHAGLNKLQSPLTISSGTVKEILEFIDSFPASDTTKLYGNADAALQIVKTLQKTSL